MAQDKLKSGQNDLSARVSRVRSGDITASKLPDDRGSEPVEAKPVRRRPANTVRRAAGGGFSKVLIVEYTEHQAELLTGLRELDVSRAALMRAAITLMSEDPELLARCREVARAEKAARRA